MRIPVFVYGTLKTGFPNFGRNRGRRVEGLYRTTLAYPLYVVRLTDEERAPWLVDQPGQGHCVTGEVFDIDAAELPALDAFEEVGLPLGYVRAPLEVERTDGDGVLTVQAYLKPPAQLPACLAVEGPFPEYTLALARGYRILG